MVDVREEPYVSLAAVLHWIVNSDEGTPGGMWVRGDEQTELVQSIDYVPFIDHGETEEADLPAFDDAAKDVRRALLEGTVKAYDPASGKAIEASEWFWDEHSGPEEDVVLARAQDTHCQILRAEMKTKWPRDRTCEDWIRRLAAKYDSEKAAGNQPLRPKRDTLMAEALNKFTDLSQRNFLIAWKRAAHEDWTKRGRRPKPIHD